METNWYTDFRATNHVTSDLEKLSIHNKYTGGDQIHTANGAAMEISHIAQYIVNNGSCKLHLKNVLYVPEANKNFVSVDHIASDNSAFIESHPKFL